MTAGERRTRPWTVTCAIVLMYIGGIGQIALGILTMFLRYVPEASDAGLALTVTLLGAAMVLFGLLVIALASGIARASRAARLGATIVMVLGVLLAILVLVLAADGDWTGVVVQLVLAAAVVLPLWLGPARPYFAVR